MAALVVNQDMIDAFRKRMKAFRDPVRWPDEIVEQGLCESIVETNQARWGRYRDVCGNFRQRGMFYFAAHWLAVMYLNGAQDETAINPNARLNLSSRSVGDESVSYRITALQDTGDDWLSTTVYGVQYYRLRRRAGMGAIAL